MGRRLILLLCVALAAVVMGLVLVPPANAADFRGGDRIVIAADQVIDDDLYVAGEEIVIDGTVNGDLYAVGTRVIINGTVQYDVFALAQTVEVNGTVGSDLRAGAMSIVLGDGAVITRGAQLGGFSVEARPESRVGNDVLFGAFQALLAGTIGRDVVAGANGIEIRGSVGGNVRVSVGDQGEVTVSPTVYMPNMPRNLPNVPAGLTIAPTASIGGEVIYESQVPANVQSGAQVTGPVVQQTPVPTRREQARTPTPQEVQQQATQGWIDWGFNQARRFVILLALGLLAMWILPKFIQALAGYARTNPVGSLGRGVLMVVGFIVALVAILMLTILLAIVFGLLTLGELAGLILMTGLVSLGVLTFLYGVFTSYIAPIVVSFLLGRAILDRAQGNREPNRFVAFLLGLVLISLLALIPVVNFIVGVAIALVALGALALWFSPMMNRTPSAPVPAAV